MVKNESEANAPAHDEKPIQSPPFSTPHKSQSKREEETSPNGRAFPTHDVEVPPFRCKNNIMEVRRCVNFVREKFDNYSGLVN